MHHRERLLPVAPVHVMANEVSRYRTILEWLLSAAALTTVVAVMLTTNSPAREYVLGGATSVSHDALAWRVPEPIAGISRTAWRVCMDHQPLAAFAGVAVVLVFFMRRMR